MPKAFPLNKIPIFPTQGVREMPKPLEPKPKLSPIHPGSLIDIQRATFWTTLRLSLLFYPLMTTISTVEYWNSMPPPELTRDTPIS